MPTSVEHNVLAGTELHVPFHYIQTSDPGAVGAGLWWGNTTTNTINQRDPTNAFWITFSSGLANPMSILGDTIYGGASGALTRLGGNVTSVRKFYVSQGALGVPTAPAWSALAAGDLPGIAVNAQTGTTYTFLQSDFNSLVTFANGSSIAATLPQAGSGGNFAAGWWMSVENTGAGTLTITPTTSTIDGASSLAMTTNQGCVIVSDGTNYWTQRGMGGGGGGSPGGSDTDVQVNSSGSFYGDGNFVWDHVAQQGSMTGPGTGNITFAFSSGTNFAFFCNAGSYSARFADGTTTATFCNGTNPAAFTGGPVDLGSHQIANVADPTNPQDAATKHYVDSSVGVLTTADLAAQSAAGTIATVTAPNDAANHQYRIGVYLAITAIATDTIAVEVVFTDQNSTSQTLKITPPGVNSATIGVTGFFIFPEVTIRVAPNTAITVQTVLILGGGTITFDAGASITQIN